MTLLYRTPNLKIDELEFHATVESTRGGAARRHFRVRRAGGMWEPLSKFAGHPPKGDVLGRRFQPFQKHMLQAAAGRVLLK